MGSVNGSFGAVNKHWVCPRLKMSGGWDRAFHRKHRAAGAAPVRHPAPRTATKPSLLFKKLPGKQRGPNRTRASLCTARHGLLRIDPLAEHLVSHRYTTRRQKVPEILRQRRYEGEPFARSWMRDRQGKRVQCLTPEPGRHAIRAESVQPVAKTGMAH